MAHKLSSTTLGRRDDAIRSILPNAVIAGPSYSRPSSLTTDFLNAMLTRNVQLNVFTEHLFGSSVDITSMFDTQQTFKATLMGTYAPTLNTTRFMVTEVGNIEIDLALQFEMSPGAALAFLANGDRIQADAVMRSCWPSWAGSNGCFDNTVDGLLVPAASPPGPTMQKPSWWVYKMYADWTSLSPVSITSNNNTVVGFAGYSSSLHFAQILLGNHDTCSQVHNCPAADVTIQISAIAAGFGFDQVTPSGRTVAVIFTSTSNDTGHNRHASTCPECGYACQRIVHRQWSRTGLLHTTIHNGTSTRVSPHSSAQRGLRSVLPRFQLCVRFTD